jgi:hypothetical protein
MYDCVSAQTRVVTNTDCTVQLIPESLVIDWIFNIMLSVDRYEKRGICDVHNGPGNI